MSTLQRSMHISLTWLVCLFSSLEKVMILFEYKTKKQSFHRKKRDNCFTLTQVMSARKCKRHDEKSPSSATQNKDCCVTVCIIYFSRRICTMCVQLKVSVRLPATEHRILFHFKAKLIDAVCSVFDRVKMFATAYH